MAKKSKYIEFWAFSGKYGRSDLEGAYETLAYALNKRMQRLERLLKESHEKAPNSLLYVQQYLDTHLKSYSRFPTSKSAIAKMSDTELRDYISFIQSSMRRKTLTRKGFKEAKKNRKQALLDNAGMPQDISQKNFDAFQKFLKTDAYNLLSKVFSYKTVWKQWDLTMDIRKNGQQKYAPETIYDRFVAYSERVKKQKDPSEKGFQWYVSHTKLRLKGSNKSKLDMSDNFME